MNASFDQGKYGHVLTLELVWCILFKRVNLLVIFFVTAQTIWPKDFKEFVGRGIACFMFLVSFSGNSMLTCVHEKALCF